MNRDLLEALGALAAEVYFDAMNRHPGLFTFTGVTTVTPDDRAIMPVLCCIDELFVVLDQALHPETSNDLECPDPPDVPHRDDDDIPF